MVSLISIVLVILFAWLQIRDVPIAVVVKNTNPDLLQRLTIILYYFCWVFGCNFDIKIQEHSYKFFPEGKLPIGAIALIVLFGFVAALLIWSRRNTICFAIVITLFMACNFIGWRYIVKTVRPIIEDSKREYEHGGKPDYFGLEKLRTATDYITGNWQVLRFVVMSLFIVLLDVFSFYAQTRELTAEAVHRLVPDTSETSIDELLPAGIFLLYVIIAEGWIWTMRTRAQISLDEIKKLRKKYRLILLDASGTH